MGPKTAGERARILLTLAEAIAAYADHLTELEVQETGKLRAVFQDSELPFAADNLRFFAGAARSLEGTGAAVLSHGFRSLLMRQPAGVVGSIAPWNFRLIMAIWKIGPALATGNASVPNPPPPPNARASDSLSSRSKQDFRLGCSTWRPAVT